ncbi:MAG: DUF1016 N-terminal domain-containing protein [Planctomycetaceae bacterium]|jgi:hypothetical protein|nr:DUF1016 N-terminal domain-containing protein [Planctomycetaceae bacterium]
MKKLTNISEYSDWLGDLKSRIKNSQIHAALSVNKELILLYWDLGKQIFEKQKTATWGNSVISQLSKDLCNEFKGATGFSKSNLYAMKQFYEFFHQPGGKLDKECLRM